MRVCVVRAGSAEDAVQSRYVLYRESADADLTLNNGVVASQHSARITSLLVGSSLLVDLLTSSSAL